MDGDIDIDTDIDGSGDGVVTVVNNAHLQAAGCTGRYGVEGT